jgi:hypothetical protein
LFQFHERRGNIRRFLFRLADIGDDAARALGLARLADIAAVQDQPVMGVAHVFGRNDADETLLDLFRRLAGRQAETVADAEDMGVDRHGRLAERHVQHDIGGLAADAGQFRQGVAVVRHLAAMVADQRLAQRDDVLRLVAPEADGADVVADLASPSASIFCGVSATLNSARVALLTPASVACADSTTATSSVKALTCSSSPFGSGRCMAKRRKISRTSAGE